MRNLNIQSVVFLALVGFSCTESSNEGDVTFTLDFQRNTFSYAGYSGGVFYPHFIINNRSNEPIFSYYDGLQSLEIDTTTFTSHLRFEFYERGNPVITQFSYHYPLIFMVEKQTKFEFYDQAPIFSYEKKMAPGQWTITGSIGYFRDKRVFERLFDPRNYKLREQLVQYQIVLHSLPKIIMVTDEKVYDTKEDEVAPHLP